MATVNRKITIAARPVGMPQVSDFHLVYSPLPSPSACEVLVRSIYLSLEPDLRGRLNDPEPHGRSVAIGEVMTSEAVALVVEPGDPELRAGDAVQGRLGWQEFAVARGREQLTTWLEQGRLQYREDVAHGIETAPQAFIRMLQRKNLGQQLVQLSES